MQPGGVSDARNTGGPDQAGMTMVQYRQRWNEPAGDCCLGECVMPIHDWSRVDAGSYHHFHQASLPASNFMNTTSPCSCARSNQIYQ